jgi:predicted permease
MRILGYEFLLSLRRLWRRPTQAGLMLATFTVSIALSLLSWSLFHTIFFQQPAFDPHGELWLIGQTGPKSPPRFVGSGTGVSATREDFNAWKEQQTVFTDFAGAMLYNSIFVATENGLERLLSANVSADALRLAGARPLMGRLFNPAEDRLGCAPVILLSEGAWRNKFAADPAIVGRAVKVDGVIATVVGVMPASFRFPNDQQMWQPLGFSPFERSPQVPVIDVIARLKPGVTISRAVEDLRQITARRGDATMAARFELHPVITPFREYFLQADLHQSSLVLLALSLVFVLVSCANAANLVMIDFFGRTSEIASALALGVPRAAAIRGLAFQLLVTVGLAALAGCAILLLAGPPLHASLVRVMSPYWILFAPQWHHFAMAAALAGLSVAIALLAPIGYLLLVDPEQIIRHGAGSSRGTGRTVWRRLLLAGQIALLTVLGISAGLLLRSTRHVGEEHWGFNARTIFNAKTAMKQVELAADKRLPTQLRLMDEFMRLPGVAAAAVMSNPVGYSGPPDLFYATSPDGLAEGRSQGGAKSSATSPGIFDVFELPFLEGENFPRDETAAGTPTAIINVSLAQRLWPGQSAVGRTLFARDQNPQSKPMTFVVRGVVRDFQASGPKAEINDIIFTSLAKYCPAYLFVYVRGTLAPPKIDDLTRAARNVDPRLPIYLPATLQGVIDTELNPVRLTARLTTIYALAAVLLCAVGVYSITVSQVLQRNREFGIRLALGIEPERLWRRFSRGHLLTAALGVALGIAGAFAAGQVLQSLLFGVNRRDPLTFAAVAAAILIVSALACIPSLFRLRRINPAECLRSL